MKIVTAASKEKDARTLACEIEFGATVADSVSLFTEEVCKDRVDSAFKVNAQGFIRGLMRKNKTDKEILEAVASWKPTLKAAGKSTEEKMDGMWNDLGAEERKAMLKKWAKK